MRRLLHHPFIKHHLVVVCAPALLVLISTASVAAEAIRFKGAPMGISQQQFQKRFPHFKCPAPDAIPTCYSFGDTYAEMPVESIEASFLRGGLAQVQVKAKVKSRTEADDTYAHWSEALHLKYGTASRHDKADTERSEFKMVVWESTQGELTLSRLHNKEPAMVSTSIDIQVKNYRSLFSEAMRKYQAKTQTKKLGDM